MDPIVTAYYVTGKKSECIYKLFKVPENPTKTKKECQYPYLIFTIWLQKKKWFVDFILFFSYWLFVVRVVADFYSFFLCC